MVVDTVMPLCYDRRYRRSAVFYGRGLYRPAGVAVIKIRNYPNLQR